VYPHTKGAFISGNFISGSFTGVQDDGIGSFNEIINNCFGADNGRNVSGLHAESILKNNYIESDNSVSGTKPDQEAIPESSCKNQ